MRSLVALKTLAPPLPQPTSSPPRSFWRGSFLAGAAGSGGRPTRSYKEVLKAHVRGGILSWSNWTLLTRFLLQSEAPTMVPVGTPHIVWGEEARPPTAAETCRRLCL